MVFRVFAFLDEKNSELLLITKACRFSENYGFTFRASNIFPKLLFHLNHDVYHPVELLAPLILIAEIHDSFLRIIN